MTFKNMSIEGRLTLELNVVSNLQLVYVVGNSPRWAVRMVGLGEEEVSLNAFLYAPLVVSLAE